jgi:hypothetical protein
MSHPDPLFDPENSYKDDEMNPNYDDHNDFWGLPENELDEMRDQMNDEEGYDDDYDDSMDGDHDSAMTSCGWGTDEDYGYFGENDDDSFYGEDY